MQRRVLRKFILQEQNEAVSSEAKALLVFETPAVVPIETAVGLRIEVSSSKVYSSGQALSSQSIPSSLQSLAREKLTWSVNKMIIENITESDAQKIKTFFENSEDDLFPVVDEDWYLIWGLVPTESPIRFNIILLANVEMVPDRTKREVIIRRFANEFLDVFENLLREKKFEKIVLSSHELNVLKRKVPIEPEFSSKPITYLNELSKELSKEIDRLSAELDELNTLLRDKKSELSELDMLLKEKKKDEEIKKIKEKIEKIEEEISSYELKRKEIEEKIKEKFDKKTTISGFFSSIKDKQQQIYREYSLGEGDRKEIREFVVGLLLDEANYGNSFAELRNYLVDAFNDFVFQVLIYENTSVLRVKSVEIIGTHILGGIMKSDLNDEVRKYIRERKITEDKLARFLFYTLFIHSLIKNRLLQRLSGSEFTITLEELLKVLETDKMKSEILITNAGAAKQTAADVQSMPGTSQDYVDKLEEAAALLLSYYNEEELLGESAEETKSGSGQTKKPTWSSLSDAIATTRNLLGRVITKLASETGVTVAGQGSEVKNLQTAGTEKEVGLGAEESGKSQPKTEAGSGGKVGKRRSKTEKGSGEPKSEITPEREVEKIGTEEVAPEFEEEETVAQIASNEIGVDKVTPAQCEQIIEHFRNKINKIIEGSQRVEGEKVGFHLAFDNYPVVITIDEMIRSSSKELRPFPIVKGSIYISVPSLQKVTRAFIPSIVDNLVRAYLWRKKTKLSDDVEKPIIVQFSYTLTPLVTKVFSRLSFYYDIKVDFGEDLKEEMWKDAKWQIRLGKKRGTAEFEMKIKSFEEKEEILQGLLPGRRRAFFFRISDDASYIVSFYEAPSFIVTRDYAEAFYDLLDRFIEKLDDKDSFLRGSTYFLISKVKKYVDELKRERYSSAGSKNTGSDRWLIISDNNEMMVIYAIASLIKDGVLKLEPDNEKLKEKYVRELVEKYENELAEKYGKEFVEKDGKKLVEKYKEELRGKYEKELMEKYKKKFEKEYELLRDEFEEIFKYLEFIVIPGGSFRFDERRIRTAALASLKFVTKQLNAASKWLLDMLSSCLLKYIGRNIIKGTNQK
jgi:hypothetical protein